jgi:hypothetical protein
VTGRVGDERLAGSRSRVQVVKESKRVPAVPNFQSFKPFNRFAPVKTSKASDFAAENEALKQETTLPWKRFAETAET